MAYFGGNFSTIAALCLAGDAHIINMGDSTAYENRDWTCAQFADPWIVFPLRWNYAVVGGVTTKSSNFARNDTYAITNATFTTYGGVVGDVDFGSWGPKLVRAGILLACTGNLNDAGAGADNADTGANTRLTSQSQGMQINRQHTAVANTYSGQGFPWPLNNGIGRPWFHDSGSGDGYAKAKLIYATHTSNTLGKIRYGLNRVGTAGTIGYNNPPTLTTIDLTSGGLDTAYNSSAWTAPVADAGNYQTTTTSVVNDHALQLYMACAASYLETSGMKFGIAASVFARCDSGGTIATNARGASCGYDAFGRSGSGVTDWADSYATEGDWTAYFTATVLNPTGVTVMFIELGRNVSEQTGGAVNSTFSTKYQSFIDKLRAAYAVSFPNGTLHICLVVPPKCIEGGFLTTDTACNSLQAAVEALAGANANCSWFSHWEYFGRAVTAPNLHFSTMEQALMHSRAKRDAMDRATNFRYSTKGRAGGVIMIGD